MIKKLIVVVIVLVVLVGALAAVIVTRDWDSPELGRALLDRAGEAAGVTMEAETFRLNLLRGLVLENVSGSSTAEGREVSFTLERLVFEHQVMPLLSGTVAVDRVLLDTPSIVLVESDASPDPDPGAGSESPDPEETSTEPPAPPDTAGLALAVEQILVRDGTLVMKREGEEGVTRIEGLDLELNALAVDPTVASLKAISAAGDLAVARVLFDELQVTSADSHFRLEDARFHLTELTFETPHGRFRADMEVDFETVPFRYQLSATGEPLDLNRIVGAGDGFGPGTVELDAEGAGAEASGIRGSGGLRLAPGEVPTIALFTSIDDAIGKHVLAGIPYEATEASFHVEEGRLTLAPFRFETEAARLDVSGWVALDGPLSLDIVLGTPREGLELQGLGGATLDLLADEEGWVPVPVTVSGTLEQPQVLPDVRALSARASEGAKREIQEKATDAIRGLFRKKKP